MRIEHVSQCTLNKIHINFPFFPHNIEQNRLTVFIPDFLVGTLIGMPKPEHGPENIVGLF